MTKAELEQWIEDNPKDGDGEDIIEGNYKLIEIEGEWKIAVEGAVNLANMGLVELPPVFHSVIGGLYCYGNRLANLKHIPDSVKYLDCSENKLTSLEYIPDSVKYLDCSENKLTSLEYIPDSAEVLYCSRNQLTSLEYCPSSVEALYCSRNQLTSLEYCPSSVEALYCRNNQLTSLEFCPLNLEEFSFDFLDEEYELYVQSEKDMMDKEASDDRVDDIESMFER